VGNGDCASFHYLIVGVNGIENGWAEKTGMGAAGASRHVIGREIARKEILLRKSKSDCLPI
jgi:hypothetical protein